MIKNSPQIKASCPWAIILLLTCGLQGSQADQTIFLEREKLCEGARNTFECAKRVEAAALQKFPKLAARHTEVLSINSRGKEIGVFVDSEEKRYTFQGMFSDSRFALIEIQHSEGNEYLLVHLRTGRRIPIKGLPVLSPDGSRFVTASGDEANFTETALEVFRVQESNAKLDTSLTLDIPGWPARPRWLNPRTIEFIVYSSEGAPVRRTAKLTSKGWRLQPK